jgi:hypothetical protein
MATSPFSPAQPRLSRFGPILFGVAGVDLQSASLNRGSVIRIKLCEQNHQHFYLRNRQYKNVLQVSKSLKKPPERAASFVLFRNYKFLTSLVVICKSALATAGFCAYPAKQCEKHEVQLLAGSRQACERNISPQLLCLQRRFSLCSFPTKALLFGRAHVEG